MRSAFIQRYLYCPRNLSEAQRICDYLILNGWKIVAKPSRADLIIIDTCALTGSEEDTFIGIIKELLKKKKEGARLIVCGCLPKINPERLSGIYNGHALDPSSISEIDKIIDARISISDVPRPNVIRPLYRGEFGLINRFMFSMKRDGISETAKKAIKYSLYRRHRIFSDKFKESLLDIYSIKIGEGCLNNCSFCALKSIFPRFFSRPMNSILSEFMSALDNGHKRFVLSAADIGAYGQDIKSNICELLKGIFDIRAEYMVSIDNFNPRWFIKYSSCAIRLFELNRERIENIHIPVQSGSDNILRLMGRGHDSGSFIRCAKELRKRAPGIKLSTSLIVGFPGESETDFLETMELIRNLGFEKVQIHKYSDRPNTPSSGLPNKISERVKEERAKRVMSQLTRSG